MKSPFDHPGPAIAIAGVGLIGGSLAAALKRHGLAGTVLGIDTDTDGLTLARRLGYIDQGANPDDAPDLLAEVDILFLSTPIDVIPETAAALLPCLSPGTIVTDVSSSRDGMRQALTRRLPEDCFFVGGHPMAGSEKRGVQWASPDLFDGATYALFPGPGTPLAVTERLARLLTGIGARPTVMSEEDHDGAVAYTSHLPYIASAALVAAAMNSPLPAGVLRQLAASGFRDTSRLASGDPGLNWAMCARNRRNVLNALQDFQRELGNLIDELSREPKAPPGDGNRHPQALLGLGPFRAKLLNDGDNGSNRDMKNKIWEDAGGS